MLLRIELEGKLRGMMEDEDQDCCVGAGKGKRGAWWRMEDEDQDCCVGARKGHQAHKSGLN